MDTGTGTISEQPLDNFQHPIDNMRLTSAEIGFLWVSYQVNTLSKCIYLYFVQKAKDPAVRSLMQNALDVYSDRIQTILIIFNSVNEPVPIGFSQSDVDTNVQELFSDNFMLLYLKYQTKMFASNFASALAMSARKDVRDFFAGSINTATELARKVDDLRLAKGLYVRPPYIPVPKTLEIVNDESFFSGLFGEKRPLTAIEMAYLFNNIITNSLGKALCMGFAQVAKSKMVQDYMLRGKKIAEKHITIFNKILKNEDLPGSMTWEHEVTDSTESPFSDKLITFLIVAIAGAGIAEYGISLSTNTRTDIVTIYSRLVSESMQYAKEGMDIMIKKGWLEEIPHGIKRRELLS